MARANRYSKPLSVILLDVNDFKKFNDTYGHPNCDSLFRYGGVEFVTLLPETPLDEAVKVAERIRIFVETESPRFLTGITKTHGVTVSVGVAALPDHGVDTQALLQKVDDLMYQAKKDGKNKVYCDQK